MHAQVLGDPDQPERKRHHEAVAERTQAEWRCVDSPGLAAAMAEDPDDRHPPSPRNQKRQRVDEAGEEADDSSSARTQVDTPRRPVHGITSSDLWVISRLGWVSFSLMTQRRAASSGS